MVRLLILVVAVAWLNAVAGQNLLEAGQQLVARLLRLLPGSKGAAAVDKRAKVTWKLQAATPVRVRSEFALLHSLPLAKKFVSP